MAVQIQLRNDTFSNWQSANPILAQGELGLEKDTRKFKIGNGLDNWNDLPYNVNDFQTFLESENGIYYPNNIGIGTTNPTSKLTVQGDVLVSGIITASGLSVSQYFGDGSSLNNVTNAENFIYVSKNGNDSNDGKSLGKSKLTIKSAIESASSETVIKVYPGAYTENNPINLPDQVSIVGVSLREVSVTPENQGDLFYVGNGNYISGMSFVGPQNSGSIVSFNPNNQRYINQSSYVQNCTNFIPNSIGMKVNGRHSIGPIKSMVLDSFTQFNPGGIGCSITNEGYAQLVSMFTICNDIAVYCGTGGGCDLTNSNSSFGNYGLVSDGASPIKYVGVITSSSPANSDTFLVNISTPTLSISTAVYSNSTGIVTITTSNQHQLNEGMSVKIENLEFTCLNSGGSQLYPSGNNGYIFDVQSIISTSAFTANVGISTIPNQVYVSGGTVKIENVKPFIGQGIYFDKLYYEVQSIKILNGGFGYTSSPIVTIDSPTGINGVPSKCRAIVENGSVVEVRVLRNGRGYETAPNIVISPPQSGQQAYASAIIKPIYYNVVKSTEIIDDIYSVVVNFKVPYAVGIGSTVPFHKISKILASSHSLEYIGSGTSLLNSLPSFGGIPIQDNEIDMRNGGSVIFTTTDQSGNFKIGDGVVVDQESGTIGGLSFTRGLYAQVTPLIIALQ